MMLLGEDVLSPEVCALVHTDYYDPFEYAEFQKKLSQVNRAEIRMAGGENKEESFYVDMVETFVKTGKHPVGPTGDVICDYLISVMADPEIRVMVLTDDVQARIFQDNLMCFVDAALKRKNFNLMRKQSEMNGVESAMEWSLDSKADGHQAFVEMLEERYEKYGFRSEFFRQQLQKKENLENQELWESMHKEYKDALNEMLQDQLRQDVKGKEENAKKTLKNLLTRIPQYMTEKEVELDEFLQAWGMMGGQWNEYDFNTYLNIVREQRVHPEILELASRMGRMIASDGNLSMWIGSGRNERLEHSSKSDIEGVTFSNDLNTLLPLELAQLMDEGMEGLFLSKFATNKLQGFRHRSEQLAPNRRLEKKRAKQKGPMIVCVDTSGSMEGMPLRLAHSMVLKLNQLAHDQKRKLYIIAFSVSARPIEATSQRAKLLEFLRNPATGSTNAEKMTQLMLEVLSGKPEYMSADVLLSSDFRMPLVSSSMLNDIQTFRANDTRFYGMQIGMNPDNKWMPYLDKVMKIGYEVSRRY